MVGRADAAALAKLGATIWEQTVIGVVLGVPMTALEAICVIRTVVRLVPND
jgi:hypothetical protein